MRRIGLIAACLLLACRGERPAAAPQGICAFPPHVATAGAVPTEFRLRSEMTTSFEVADLCVAVDDRSVLDETTRRSLVEALRKGESPTFTVATAPGVDHRASFRFAWIGSGAGIYGNLKGYRFDVTSSRSFSGGTACLDVISYEQGTPATPLEERPAVRYVERKRPRDESTITFRLASHLVLRALHATIDGELLFTLEQSQLVVDALNDRKPATWSKKLGTGEHAVFVKAIAVDGSTKLTSERKFTFASGPGRNLEIFLGVDKSPATKQLGIVFTQVVEP